MPRIKNRARLSGLKGAQNYTDRIASLEEENLKLRCSNESMMSQLCTLVLTLTLVKGDVEAMRKSKSAAENENSVLKKKIKKSEASLKNMETEYIKMREMRKNDIHALKVLSASNEPRLRPYDTIKDYRTKKSRCLMVVEEIKKMLRVDEIGDFLQFFFKYLNNSGDFCFRYQLTIQETFSAKSRFQFSDRFFKNFRKFYNDATGLELFSSRAKLGVYQKSVSVAQYYHVEVEVIIKKLKSGIIKMEKPIVRITNLVQILSNRLTVLAQNGLINLQDKLTVAVGGDKGSDVTKLVLVIENVSRSNSTNGILLLGFYYGNDDHASLKAKLSDVFLQFNSMKTITYFVNGVRKEVRVEKKLVGDIRFTAGVYGHRGQSSKNPCHLCFIEYVTHGSMKAYLENTDFEFSIGQRTLSDYSDPLVEIDPIDASLSPMHCFQGLVSKFGVDSLRGLANQVDFGDDGFPDDLEDQKRSLKELEDEEKMYSSRDEVFAETGRKFEEVERCYVNIKARHRANEASCDSTICIAFSIKRTIVADDDSCICKQCERDVHKFCTGIISFQDRVLLETDGLNACFDCCDEDPLTISERIEMIREKSDTILNQKCENENALNIVKSEIQKLTELLTQFNGPTRQKLDDYMNFIKCENFSCSKNLTGNQCRRFLRKEHIDGALNIFPRSQRIEDIRTVLYHFMFLMSSSDAKLKTDEEVSEIKDRVKEMIQDIRRAFPRKGVTVKLHLVSAHLIDHLEKHKSWGMSSEQGVEAIHAVFNSLDRQYAAMWDQEAKAMCYVQHCANKNTLFDTGEI